MATRARGAMMEAMSSQTAGLPTASSTTSIMWPRVPSLTFYWVVDTRVYEILELAGEMVRREERARLRQVG